MGGRITGRQADMDLQRQLVLAWAAALVLGALAPDLAMAVNLTPRTTQAGIDARDTMDAWVGIVATVAFTGLVIWLLISRSIMALTSLVLFLVCGALIAGRDQILAAVGLAGRI